MHERYHSVNRHNNDIGLIKLRRRIPFKSNNKIAPICLPNGYDANAKAIVTGWGKVTFGKYVF